MIADWGDPADVELMAERGPMILASSCRCSRTATSPCCRSRRAAIPKIQDHVSALKSQNIPYGLHTFGRVPPAEQVAGVLAESMTGRIAETYGAP